MNFGAVLIPAVVGYWILRQTHYFRPAVAQTPSYAFAFYCASIGMLAGVAALGLTRLVHLLVRPEPAAWYPWWQAQLSFEDPSTATVMILLAVIASRFPWEWGEDVAIVPVAIGYRDEATRSLILTRVRGSRAQPDEANVVALPRASVISVTTFTASNIAPPPGGAQVAASPASGAPAPAT